MRNVKSIYEIPYLSSRQVADYFGIDKSTVNRWIANGKIEAARLGNRNKIPQREFQRIENESYK